VPDTPSKPRQWDKKKVGELPKPRFRVVRDTDQKRNVVKFFDYWRSLSGQVIPLDAPDAPQQSDLIEFRVYRLWPACDVRQVRKEVKTNYWEFFEGEIQKATLQYSLIAEPGEILNFDVESYEDLFNERYGAGEWHILLNEKGVSGPLMEAYFKCGDLGQHPPKIDYRMIVKGSPKNEGYIRWLENQNIPLPWTQAASNSEEEEDMAANEALKMMADTVVNQSKQNAELAEKIADARVEAIENAQPDEEQVAVNESIKMVTETARESNKMMADMVKQHAGKQYDPVEMMRATTEFLTPFLKPGTDDGGKSSWMEMTKLLLDNQAKVFEVQSAGMREEMSLLKSIVLGKNADGSPVTAVARVGETSVAAPKSFADQLKELRTMSELMGWTNGGGKSKRDDEEVEKPAEKSIWLVLAENAGPIMTGLTTLGFLAANVIYNSRLKPEEKPVAPQEALQKMNQQPGAPAGAQPQPHAAQPAAASPLGEWGMFIQQIEGPLLQHFFHPEGPKGKGYDLAYWVQTDGNGATITPTGRQTYMILKERLGFKGLDLLIKNYEPIWNKVKGTPQQYEQFLKEFFTYDEFHAVQDQESEAA
jgi:hypothetical protein